MELDPRIEKYLESLDLNLRHIALSDRSEILTEIKSHILEKLQDAPEQSVEDVLEDLGSPQKIAQDYIEERGLKPRPVSKHKNSPVKWLVFGLLGLFGITLTIFLVLLWKFTPLIEVNQDRVSLFGGAIDIASGADQQVWRGAKALTSSDDDTQSFQGTMEVDPKELRNFQVLFGNGSIEFKSKDGGKVSWDCKMSAGTGHPFSKNKELFLDLRDSAYAKCEIAAPRGISYFLKGDNGMIQVENLSEKTRIVLSNGIVRIEENSNFKYRYKTEVVNGVSLNLNSSDDSNAIPIEVSVTNGQIIGVSDD